MLPKFTDNKFASVELKQTQNPWDTAKAYHEAAKTLLPDKHIRVGVGNGKITLRAHTYDSNGWETAFRK